MDREVLRLSVRFEDATHPDKHEAMSQYDARLLLEGVRDYNQPWIELDENVRSLCDQLERALPPVPDGGWRSYVAALAHEAGRLLLQAGPAVRA